jgi:hypothetical protein
MDHDYDIGAPFQSSPVAGFLVRSIAHIPLMANHMKAKSKGNIHRSVSTAIVYKDRVVHNALFQGRPGFFECPFSIIGG